jgi:hypothetical protein
MSASSVTGKGLGEAGVKATTHSNVSNSLFVSVANDGDTIADNITAVFLTIESDYTLYLPNPADKVGSLINFKSQNVGGTIHFNEVYGGTWNFSSSYVSFSLISDGNEWSVFSWYNYD